MTPDELTDRLVERVRNYAKKMGRNLAPEAEVHVRNLIAGGVPTLLSIKDRADRDKAIAKAEDDIDRLVYKMIEEAMELTRKEKYPRDRLGERTFFPAKLRFCPCPPFC